MFERILQIIAGNNNKSAGRDIKETTHIYNFNPHPIRFYEQDLKEIIECFSKETDNINNVIENTTDFYRPKIKKKNEINRLSNEYFEHIKKNSLMHFEKISIFLKDIRNEEFLKMYLSTTTEINNKIVCNRREFEYFEKIFDAIYNYIVEKSNYELPFNKELIWVFLHYMYYSCDIGDKHDQTS
ncbi:ABC-three component system protein [Bacillus swezeyi]|uniref:ABC-three component system protein n=1 Tax=Bacillus swezeyi TaxID=1925020 RepID=UPI0027DD3B6F|nr:ABC-three component system protein [Bacillus swezeyi]